MATYNPKRKTGANTFEQIKIPVANVVGAAEKITYEWNRVMNFGSTGKLYIGRFKVYDSNITVEFSCTTSSTYSGKLVIATQNGQIRSINVYGDASNTLTPNIYVLQEGISSNRQWIQVYFSPSSYSKNIIHIKADAIDEADTATICTNVTAIPETATTKPTNALTTAFLGKTATAVNSSQLGGVVASEYARKTDIPTATSDLDNDSGFTNLSGLTATVTELNYVDGVSSNIQTQLNGKVKSVTNSSVTVLGTSKKTETVGTEQLVFPKGAIFSGSAANAGLVTRGICGVTSPGTTGGCSKENLYINYDSTNTYNASRQVVLQAGSVGTHYGNNLYQYCAARGDAVKGYCDATYAKASDIPSTYLTGGSQTTTSTADGGSNVYTFTKSDGTTSSLTVKNGSKGSAGARGAGIASITVTPV